MNENNTLNEQDLEQVSGGKNNKIDPNKKSPYKVHVVKRGDTMSAIAYKYGSKVSDIARLNNISNPDILEVDQELLVPNK